MVEGHTITNMNYKIIISAWLSVSIAIDYMCTLWFAGTTEYLIKNEYSALLIYAASHNILIPVLILIMIIYFTCAYIALDALYNHRLIPIAYMSISLVAIAHTFGGLSWYIQNETYSSMIIIMPRIAAMLLMMCLVYLLVDKVVCVYRTYCLQ